MRWIVAVVGLVLRAWFLSDRQRRARVQEKLRGAIPMDGTASGDDTAITPSEMMATARAKVAEVQATWPRTASHVVDLATSAGSVAVQKAHELGTAARQSTGDAVDQVQAAAGAAIDRAQHAMQTATGQAQEARSATPPSVTAEAERGMPPPELHATMPAAQADKDRDDTVASETGLGASLPERESRAFIGNVNTRVFHGATARNLPAEDNRQYFETVEEALAAGFRPAEREDLEGAGEQ